VALYAKDITVSGMPTTWPQFVWQVDPELCAAAHRFVDTFNTLFGRELPAPVAKNAHAFAAGFDESQIVGRCVRLGQAAGSERILGTRDLDDRTVS